MNEFENTKLEAWRLVEELLYVVQSMEIYKKEEPQEEKTFSLKLELDQVISTFEKMFLLRAQYTNDIEIMKWEQNKDTWIKKELDRIFGAANNYFYGCNCGEKYLSVEAALMCKKCKNYSIFGVCTHVLDLRTGEIVGGKEPTEKEYKQAQKEYEEKLKKQQEESNRIFGAENETTF